MRILYIDHHAATPAEGGDPRALQLAREWQKKGDEVVIVTAGYSHRRSSNPTLREDLCERSVSGVKFCYLMTPAYRAEVGEARRSVQAFCKKLYTAAAELAERYRPEAVIAASEYPYDYFGAKRIAGICRAQTVLEVREIYPVLRRELYPNEESRVIRFVCEYAMDHALKGADAILSFLPGIETYCRERGITPKNLTVLPPPEPPKVPAQLLKEGDAALWQQLRERYPFVVAYAGKLSARRMPELLLGAVGSLQQKGIAAVIAGNGGYKMLLRRQIKENGWENILLLDALSERRRRTLFAAADALYYGDDRRLNARYGSDSPFLLKLMQAEKPIAMAVHGERDAASQSGCALRAASVTQDDVAAVLQTLFEMTEDQRRELGEKAASALQQRHSLPHVAEEYRRMLQRLHA